MPLSMVEEGEPKTIVKVGGKEEVRKFLENLGFVDGTVVTVVSSLTKGVEIYVRKVAPLGDPVEITVRNYELSVRKADAAIIEVE